MADRALVVRDLAVSLQGRRVLRDVSMVAGRGSVTALLGPNGAGKTTLLRAVLGLVPRTRGAVTVEGHDLATLDRRERARRIAYLPQRSVLDAPLEVTGVIAHGRYAHGDGGFTAALTAADRRAVERAMDVTDVGQLAGRRFTELSGGEQRRVLLARALATGARILLFDEPAASLDIGHTLALFALLARLARDGFGAVVAMHDLAAVHGVADRAVLLDRGRVVAAGATAEVLAADSIRRVYGVEARREHRLVFRLAGKVAGDVAGPAGESEPS